MRSRLIGSRASTETAANRLAFNRAINDAATARLGFRKRRNFAGARQIRLHVKRLSDGRCGLRLNNCQRRSLDELTFSVGGEPRLVGIHRLGHSHSTAL
ncbi:hypothetical protein [uncultured Erythrobacter sp.]|uniref:hypothetical protein n=1 Tax=uncultured Erythrobacter sp. TaxID=263913 RepID=UPI0026229848|nr:hypothetical protein [uncultured Erythrobacter sp.]